MAITENDIRLLKEHNKEVRITVKLVEGQHYPYQEIDSLTGTVVSASFNKNYDSDIRTTCSLTISVKNKDHIEDIDFDQIWNNNLVELQCGVYDKKNKEWVDYGIGLMIINDISRTYDSTSQEVKINLVDMMASLTEERGSQIGTDLKIEAGANVGDVLVEVFETFGTYHAFNIISEFDDTIPYDLEFSGDAYPIEIFDEILSLFPYYEMFYNSKGVFVVQKIPDEVDDPIDIDHDILDELLISESKDNNYSEIINTTEIWGDEISCQFVAESCSQRYDPNPRYSVIIQGSYQYLIDGDTYLVKPDANSEEHQSMTVNGLGTYNIYNVSGAGAYTEIGENEMIAETLYVIRYIDRKFILIGESQIRCIVQEITEMPSIQAQDAYKHNNNCYNVQWVVNPDSPYACTLTPTTRMITGEHRQVLRDGEYAKIYTTQLAYERARYENWLKCRMVDMVSIQTILIPWIEVNKKIRYTSPTSGEQEVYMVQSVDFNFEDWTMDVSASKFYPYYPWDE